MNMLRARILHRCALVACLLVAAAAYGRPAKEAFDRALREVVHTVPVPEAGASIVVTSYRPRGDGPFPWIVLSHGTATTPEANRTIGRFRNLPLVREWVKRGYAVLVPIRRGYGASGGDRFGDSYGSCGRPDFVKAGEGAALDLLAAVHWAKSQSDLDPSRWMLVGQSAGGFASIYTASKRPEGLVAVLAFSSGRGGNPETRPGAPCAAQQMAALYASIAPKIRVPVLWFYAENDQFIGPAAQKLWFDSFRNAGGRGELVVIAPFPERQGHGVFTSKEGVAWWAPAVRDFYKAYAIALPF